MKSGYRTLRGVTLLARREEGVALIMALLVVSLVAAIAAGMATDYLVTVKRAANQVSSELAFSYLRAAEVVAVKALREDLFAGALQGSDNIDGCNDIWAQETPPMVLEEGMYGGRIQDLQGRFNLNSLLQTNSGIHQARFYRLVKSFDDLDDMEVTDETARCVTEALIDWLDADQETTGFCGAEDEAYSDIEGQHPYRTADRPMRDVSELLLVMHMTPRLYTLLLPHITVWPEYGGEININTATDRVLRSLNVPESAAKKPAYTGRYAPPLDERTMLTMLQSSTRQEYSDINSFLTDLKNVSGVNVSGVGLSVQSSYFMLNAEATINELHTRLFSVIYRDSDAGIKVLNRSFSQSPEIKTCLRLELDEDTGRLEPVDSGDEEDGDTDDNQQSYNFKI